MENYKKISKQCIVIAILGSILALGSPVYAMRGAFKRMVIVAAVMSAADPIVGMQAGVIGLQDQRNYPIGLYGQEGNNSVSGVCRRIDGQSGLFDRWGFVNAYNQCGLSENKEKDNLTAQMVVQEVMSCSVEEQKKLNKELFVAAQKVLADDLKRLLEAGADVHAKDEQGRTPLMGAAFCGHIEVVKLLIEAGAHINEQAGDGSTVLTYAVGSRHCNPKVVDLLIKSNIDLNKRDESGFVALEHAMMRGHSKVVKLLVDAGAQINMLDGYGNTVLSKAVALGDVDVVRLLVEAGASVGMQELGAAYDRGNNKVVKFLALAKTKQALFQKNGDKTLLADSLLALGCYIGGNYFVRVADKYRKEYEIRNSIFAGIRPDAVDGLGTTPWSRATRAERAVMKCAQQEREQHQLAVLVAGKNFELLGEGLELPQSVLGYMGEFANAPLSNKDKERKARDERLAAERPGDRACRYDYSQAGLRREGIRRLIFVGVHPDAKLFESGATLWNRSNPWERSVIKKAWQERQSHQVAVELARKNPKLLGEGLELPQFILDHIGEFANAPMSKQDTERLVCNKMLQFRSERGWYFNDADDAAAVCCAAHPDCACAH